MVKTAQTSSTKRNQRSKDMENLIDHRLELKVMEAADENTSL